MSSNYLTAAELEELRKKEIEDQQREISLSYSFNLRLSNVINNLENSIDSLKSIESTFYNEYAKTLGEPILKEEIDKLKKLEIQEFNLTSDQLKDNRLNAEKAFKEIINKYDVEYQKIQNEIDENKTKIEKYDDVNKLINSTRNIFLNFNDLILGNETSILRKKVINEIKLLIENENVLKKDKDFLKDQADKLENEENEKTILETIQAFVMKKRKIVTDALDSQNKYYQYVYLNKELNDMTNQNNTTLQFEEFNNIEELEQRVEYLMKNICQLKEQEYIFEKIIEVCKWHGFNIINSNQNIGKIKILHKSTDETALKISNNKNMYHFEILSLIKGDRANGITPDYSNANEIIKDRLAFCSIHPKIVEELHQRFGIKLNVCSHSDDPKYDPCHKIEIDQNEYNEIFEEKNQKEQQVKYENL